MRYFVLLTNHCLDHHEIAMPVKRWRMDVNSGKLFFDREFALVDSSGTALRLCQYPKMGSIRPHIDMDRMVLDVSAPDRPKLSIDLRADGRASSIKEIKVCGNKCGGKLWGSHAVSSWFTEYLGVQCWLARSQEGKYSIPKDVGGVQNPARQSNRIGFENEAPLLLVSTNSIDRLNQVLENQSSRQVNARYFRPNLVVAMDYGGSNNNPEDQWRSIHVPHSDIELSVTGQCARCSMVDIDPDSGMKGFTLRALAEYRRNKGQITFGIFLRMAPPKNELSGNEALWIETGEVINIK
jgi:molybdenum cofactor sulfurtransferase